MNTAPSEARICQIKDVTEEDAKLIRDVWKAPGYEALHAAYPRAVEFSHDRHIKLRQIKRMCVDQIIQTMGVEFLGIYTPSGENVYYCNAGETYATTVIFFSNRLVVGCLGDLVGSNKIKQVNTL